MASGLGKANHNGRMAEIWVRPRMETDANNVERSFLFFFQGLLYGNIREVRVRDGRRSGVGK